MYPLDALGLALWPWLVLAALGWLAARVLVPAARDELRERAACARYRRAVRARHELARAHRRAATRPR